MALFTSTDGKFEVTALSFSPHAVVWDESTNWSITLKNLTGKKITKLNMHTYVMYRTTSGPGRASKMQWWVHDPDNVEDISVTVNWANNAEMTFSGTSVYSLNRGSPVKPFTTRCVPTYEDEGLKLYIGWNDNDIDSLFENLYGDNNEYFGILDQHYNPTIEAFDIERVSDEAEEVKTTIKLGLADGLTDDQKARMLFTLTDGSGNAVTLNATQAELLAGITDSLTAVAQTFARANNHKFMLTFGDAFESQSAPDTIARSFANVHLSGNAEGGMCVGGFCDPANPGRFECYYPAYFYGGIAQGGVKDYPAVGEEQDTGVKWIDGKTIYRKVIIIDSPAKGTNQYIDIGASGTIDKLISIRGIGVSSTGAYPMPTIATSDYNIVIFEGSGNPVTQVLFYQGTKRGITWAFGVVEYTLADSTT